MACSGGSGGSGNSKSALENLFAACVDLDRREEGREGEIDGEGGGSKGEGREGGRQDLRFELGEGERERRVQTQRGEL